MKKKFLAALLFLSIIISGCYGDDSSSTSDVQTNQPAVEKKVSTEVETEDPQDKKEDKSRPSTEKSSETENPEHPEQDSEDTNKPSESTKPDDKQGVPIEKKSEGLPGVSQPEPSSETPSEEQNEPSEENVIGSLLGDNMMMTGIIAALIVVVLILAWLIYDRHKMKNTLNTLNNRPPKPDNPPQNMNKPSQSATSLPTIVNQSPVNEQLTIRVDNLQNIGARKEQQDSFCVSNIGDKKAVSEKGLMAVVADGMGGLEGGALISRLVTDTFLDSYNNQFSIEPTSFLYRTAESAELAVENYMKQTGINGGSTLVAVIIKDSQMNYISVGDSHIYLLRDNTLTLINKEHNFGALLKEQADRGEIDPREPYINPKRNALTAYIGMGSFNIVDKNAHPIILRGGDKILLCSDGVYNALGDNALIAALAGDASTAARKLQADILAQNIPSQDNFTAVILECVRI